MAALCSAVPPAASRVIGLATTVARGYNINMIRENIRELLDRDPFVPFRLVMTGGKVYEVVSPNSAALLKSEVFVVFPDGERGAHVPFLHIASIETIVNGRGRGSGRSKRR